MQHQPEAYASDLGDDQSRYLLINPKYILLVLWRHYLVDLTKVNH